MVPDVARKVVRAGDRMVGAVELFEIGDQLVVDRVRQEVIAVQAARFRLAAPPGDQRHSRNAA
jgi:hypothetical protein